MKKQLSRSVLGTILTLLILGLSYKGNFGEVPVNSHPVSIRDLVAVSKRDLTPAAVSKINSMFVRESEGRQPSLIVLIAHHALVAKQVQEALQTQETPLLFSISALPLTDSAVDLAMFSFRQKSRVWSADQQAHQIWFPLSTETHFGGPIKDGEIHNGIILIPEWFSLSEPITLVYGNNERTFNFMLD